ncbi:MAG: hypothetical protein K1060chlam5_01232 [Candidatus Anoxychlamydiales bacterium]|nr:hypothetical protein [Candidatus Anoxychlamydiales bacterium]
MLKSMTGFSKEKKVSQLGSLSLEISCINKRFFESKIILPKEFTTFENEIRKKIEEKIKRGQIFLRFDFFPSQESISYFVPDEKLLKNLKTSWEDLSTKIGFKKEDITIEFLLNELKNFKQEKVYNLEKFKILFFEIFDSAIDKLISMQLKEGQNLQKDIEKRILIIQKELTVVEKEAPKVKEIYKNKLQKRIDEISTNLDIDEDRILKEVAIFAEKTDITEEIIRLKSHLSQFLKLSNEKESMGRKLDFLLQEILREINTIASKSASLNISKHIIEIKSEVEKIKEQLQNIE